MIVRIRKCFPTIKNQNVHLNCFAYEEISREQLYRTPCRASLTKQMVCTVTQSYFHIALLGSTVDGKQSNQIINL